MKTLKIELPDERHGRLAAASWRTHRSMAAIILDGVDPELERLSVEFNAGKPWRRRAARQGRPPKAAR